MKPRRFADATDVYRLPGGNEDNDLWVKVEEVEQATLGVVKTISSVWEPSEAERQAIASGASVELTIFGDGQPPVWMGVTNVRLGKP